MDILLLLPAAGIALGAMLVLLACLPPAPINLVTAIARTDALAAHPELAQSKHRWWITVMDLIVEVSGRSTSTWWGLPAEELSLLEQTPARYVGRRLVCAGLGFTLAALITVRIGVPALMVPTGLATAVAVSLVPWYSVRHAAGVARVEFLQAIAVLFDLTAQERDAGRAPGQALTAAVAVADGWVFRRVRSAVRSAIRLGITPWDALSTLSVQVGVSEVNDLAEVIATAADGAAVSHTLRDKATALRVAAIHAETAATNARSEWLFAPLALLVIGMLILVLHAIAAQLPGY